MRLHEVTIKRKTLEKRKAELISQPPITQKHAQSVVNKIAKRVFKYKIEKERILKPYIVDIYIKDIKVGIEIDGGVHDRKGGYDNRRDEYLLKTYKVKIYRFDNNCIDRQYFKNAIWQICIDGLKDKIRNVYKEASIRDIYIPLGSFNDLITIDSTNA